MTTYVQRTQALISKDQQAIDNYKTQLAKARSDSYQARALQTRIRSLEDAIKRLEGTITASAEALPFAPYSAKRQKIVSGVLITVGISLDGQYYSNPAPDVPNGAHIWVQAKIDDAHRGKYGDQPETRDIYRVSWVVPAGWAAIDVFVHSGTPNNTWDEYFVSFPADCTREFYAPGSGPTNGKFGVFADVYHEVPFPGPFVPGSADSEALVYAPTGP